MNLKKEAPWKMVEQRVFKKEKEEIGRERKWEW